jgi:hypothetical protein
MHNFIHVRSAKFPILPGEREELVNDGTYGKALAEYLQKELTDRGYHAPFVCGEDAFSKATRMSKLSARALTLRSPPNSPTSKALACSERCLCLSYGWVALVVH